MNTSFPSALIYLFGFIGLLSIGLIPFRSWQVMKSAFSNQLPTIGKVVSAFLVLITAVAIWSDISITARIFRCLTEPYCGPSVASGWTYLAILGVVYAVFELVVLLVRKFRQVNVIKPIA